MALSPFRARPRSSSAPSEGKLLYVEDEDLNWDVTHHALRSKYAMTRARSAKEAFEALGREDFDIILMDIQLGGSELNGLEITQIIKGRFGSRSTYAVSSTTAATPVLFVSAYGARYDKTELLAAGGADMIAKPVNVAGLSLAIARLISKGVQEQLSPKKP